MNAVLIKIQEILRTGVENPAAKLSKYTLRSNFINLTLLVLITIYGIGFYFLGAVNESLLMILVFSLFVPVFYFNRKKLYTLANLLAAGMYCPLRVLLRNCFWQARQRALPVFCVCNPAVLPV